MVLGFSERHVGLDFMCWSFFAKIYFVLAFVQNFNHFGFQGLETLEWRLFLKIFVHLQASIWPFTWAHITGLASYLSENFKLPKCWTSEVPHSSSPISNCPTIQTVDIFFPLVREPICPPYPLNLFFDIFKSFPVFIILSIGWHVNYADLVVRLWLSTFRIICPRFLRTGVSPEFTWIFINPVCGVFFPGVFSPWPKKKRHLKKNLQKMFVQTQSI